METRNYRMIKRIMLSYAFTFMMIELADASSMVIDGVIVSRGIGASALAATGLADPSFKIVALFCGIFAVGMQVSCSTAMGAGDSKKTDELFSGGCIITAAVAVILTILSFLFINSLCRLFGADGSDEELFLNLRNYLRGWFIGIPGFVGFTVLTPLVTLDGNKKSVVAATATQSAINIVGDYLSVAVLDAGTYGVGFSTGLGFDIALIILILNFFRKKTSFHFRFTKLNNSALADMIRIGMPRVTKYGCKMLAPLLINRTAIAIGGSSAVAAMAVKASIGGFFLIAGSGIAESVSILSQVFYGEKDKDALYQTARSACKADLIVCTALSVILFSFSRFIAGIYLSSDAEGYRLTVTMLRYFSLSVAINGLNCVILCYLQGTKKILPAHLQTASHRLVFLTATTYILGSLFGVNGLFIAIPVSEIIVLLVYVVCALAIGKGKEPADALLLLPEDFGYSADDSMSFSVTSLDDAVGISEKVYSFCKNHNMDKRRSYYASLCVEELACNVVKHGFTKDTKEHSCNIRVMIENDDILLRIRDDCRFFNLKERYEAMGKGDIASNVGIRLVYGIAKDINYINLLNTNTLLIRV